MCHVFFLHAFQCIWNPDLADLKQVVIAGRNILGVNYTCKHRSSLPLCNWWSVWICFFSLFNISISVLLQTWKYTKLWSGTNLGCRIHERIKEVWILTCPLIICFMLYYALLFGEFYYKVDWWIMSNIFLSMLIILNKFLNMVGLWAPKFTPGILFFFCRIIFSLIIFMSVV